MDKILVETIYFGLVISFLSYWIAVQIRKKLPFPIFNPLLISAIICIVYLILTLIHIIKVLNLLPCY